MLTARPRGVRDREVQRVHVQPVQTCIYDVEDTHGFRVLCKCGRATRLSVGLSVVYARARDASIPRGIDTFSHYLHRKKV